MNEKSASLRKGRVNIVHQIYHIRFSTYHNMNILNFECGSCVARSLVINAGRIKLSLLCWVVMPNHVHALVQLDDEDSSISRYVQKVKRDATCAFKNRGLELDRFWQDGFFDRAIRKDEDIKSVARYIVANPLRAGLVGSVREYALWDAVWLEK